MAISVGADRRPPLDDERLAEAAQRALLHLAVLELAEHVLHALELLDQRGDLVGREQAAEALEGVAQLLGVLAQVVHAAAAACRR